MDSGVLMSLTASRKAEAKLDVITENLANISTIGYKANQKSFGEMVNEYIGSTTTDSNEISTSEPSETNKSVRKVATDFSPGRLYYTGSALDVAILTDGLFKINSSDGLKYTRNGHFSMDSEGRLITVDGSIVSGDSGEIEVRGKDVEIQEDGTIKVDGASKGKIAVVTFEDISALERAGNYFYLPAGKENLEKNVDSAKLSQGYLEQSNVNIVQEMVKMIGDLRANESYQKVLQNFDSVDLKAANEIGKF